MNAPHREGRATPIPILMYHNIASPPPGAAHRGLYLPPARFRRQLQTLRLLGYRGMSMDEGLPYLRGERRGKVAIITFDDGYRDNLDHALPLLRALGFTASCYLVADCLGTHNRWDAELLKVQKPIMDVEAVGRWLRGGMRIGSHTLSHPHLSHLSLAEKQREIAESKTGLENLLGVAVEHFCYPYGDYDEDCLTTVRASGYLTAVTTRRGRAQAGQSLLELPRLGNSGRKVRFAFQARALGWALSSFA